MSTPSQEAQRLAAQVADLSRIEVDTRLRLLKLHATKLALVGILVLAYGGAQTVEDILGVWTRGVTGFAALTAGIAIGVGVRHQHLPTQAAGLVLAGLWDLAMGVAFVATFAAGGADLVPTAFWQATPDTSPVLYPAALYVALASMVWGVHLVTVLKLQRRSYR